MSGDVGIGTKRFTSSEAPTDTFSLAEFIVANQDDVECDDLCKRLAALNVGESFSYDAGAGGTTTFKRVL